MNIRKVAIKYQQLLTVIIGKLSAKEWGMALTLAVILAMVIKTVVNACGGMSPERWIRI